MLTDEQLAEIRARYVAKRDTKCRMGVDADVGAQEYLDWLEEYGKWWLAHEAFGNSAVADMGVLLAEVERLRGDAELGRLVREVLPRLGATGPAGLLAFMDGCWFAGNDDQLGPSYDKPEDALRKADA